MPTLCGRDTCAGVDSGYRGSISFRLRSQRPDALTCSPLAGGRLRAAGAKNIDLPTPSSARQRLVAPYDMSPPVNQRMLEEAEATGQFAEDASERLTERLRPRQPAYRRGRPWTPNSPSAEPLRRAKRAWHGRGQGFESPKLHSLFLLASPESHKCHFRVLFGSSWTWGAKRGARWARGAP
jgi:hypothetical protein